MINPKTERKATENINVVGVDTCKISSILFTSMNSKEKSSNVKMAIIIRGRKMKRFNFNNISSVSIDN